MPYKTTKDKQIELYTTIKKILLQVLYIMKDIMKIVIIGDSFVGKTTLALTYIYGSQTNRHVESTVGMGFLSTVVNNTRVELWDTAGQERYRSMSRMYYRTANVALLCFSLCDMHTFNNLEGYYMSLKIHAPDHCIIVLVGTKCDVDDDDRVIDKGTCMQFAKNKGCRYYETSSFTGANVNDLFNNSIKEVHDSDVKLELCSSRDPKKVSRCCSQ